MTTAELTHEDHVARLRECATRVRATPDGHPNANIALDRLAYAIRDSVLAGLPQEDRKIALTTV
ncbi:gp05 [Rhodococcus phage ReqiPine5]|uniref:Gp05 n=1 Tax=Rhodococcus phage ReqiPine5 TaxID=691963 RepID=D4P7Y0_9CAUD|nr:gp05 [Rhodococcus phage ReqiPine5]ADD81110.1 gp05 [Rhodococcus phage ReqiPine5]